ncbi:hypothetical protein [Novosphingobium aquae]|uniref:Uncharacterized protein n=1 Tax=Novosphingobium aquae TaxID=3133435 RepID=A0ABU8SD01_9SPHN
MTSNTPNTKSNEEILFEFWKRYGNTNPFDSSSQFDPKIAGILPKVIEEYFMEALTLKDQAHKAEVEEAKRKEVEMFMYTLQERGNTIPANLILNEVVNYAYDRMKEIATPLPESDNQVL